MGKVGDKREFRYIGKNYTKVDGLSKCTGATRFADDLSLPRMLYCKLLRADVAHAKIKSIDTSAAEAMDGVKAVLLLNQRLLLPRRALRIFTGMFPARTSLALAR